jgi:hypothetical protein
MIKFFRKIRQNLFMGNKTGKYLKYAIGEIVLVMVGILLALQINNWNENRVAQARIDIRLTNLTEDLKTEIKEMSKVIEGSKDRIIVTKAILKGSNRLGSFWIRDTIFQEYNSAKFTNPNSIISEAKTLDGNRSTYNGLISSAEFYLIKNQTLASRIQKYYERINEINDIERWDIMETYLLVNKSKHRLGLGTWSSEVTMENLIQSAKNDLQFGAELEQQYRCDLDQYNYMTNQKKEAIDLIKAIESREY